ncbi:Ribbon-helix-helix protein, copG family [Halobiforma haloterrestris]|uniref:Ribbon-helix-helix protein, copG family n=2 Tax=Natronobacterium haloterrestre TaxID=148448 RepID=A0A1I1LBI6_NATHA|nr:Ribbon-helix-helix protein, copG family [Halobiforma haloterrestris]
MPADQSETDDYIEYPDQERRRSPQGGCEVCGSAQSLREYSLGPPSKDDATVVLCSTHYQVAAMLGGSRYLDATATDYDLQETQKVTVRVPKALIESADSAAEQQGQTRSEFVRDGIQMAIELQDVDDAFEDILVQAITSSNDADPEASGSESESESEPEPDVEFLKERIRRLESLLEDSLDKI